MRKCGDCTVCCTLSVVPDYDKKAGELCVKCVGGGCQVYGSHPQVCKDFECAYYQAGKDVKLRPDKCGVMFLKKTDRIFCGILAPGIQTTGMAIRQVQSLNDQGYSVVMMKIGERPHIRLAHGHDSAEIYQEYSETLNGNL